MPIVITDETAAHTAIGIDTSRNFGVGTSSPGDRLNCNGTNMAGSGGLADGSTVDSTSLVPTTGLATIAFENGQTTISTTPTGREPLFSIIRLRQALFATSLDGGISCAILTQTYPVFNIIGLGNGFFTIQNDEGDDGSTDSGGNLCSRSLATTDDCQYAWV